MIPKSKRIKQNSLPPFYNLSNVTPSIFSLRIILRKSRCQNQARQPDITWSRVDDERELIPGVNIQNLPCVPRRLFTEIRARFHGEEESFLHHRVFTRTSKYIYIFQNSVVPDVRGHGTRHGLHGLQQLPGIYGESIVHHRRDRILSDPRVEFPG